MGGSVKNLFEHSIQPKLMWNMIKTEKNTFEMINGSFNWFVADFWPILMDLIDG